MIATNLSHETYVNDPQYDNLPGVEYETVEYTNYEYVRKGKGDTWDKIVNVNEPTKICRFAQPRRDDDFKIIDESRGMIARILMELLAARKATKKKMAAEKDPFKKSVLNSLQNAFKITANSVYGSLGAKTSALFLKELAASTTSVGRRSLITARDYMVENYGAEAVYGDTDSVFMRFPCKHEDGTKMQGLDAIRESIRISRKASQEVTTLLPSPNSLVFEKAIYPFMLLSKKRYIGGYYEDEGQVKPKIKNMGVVLKRRDNPPIVKHFFAGVADIFLRHIDHPDLQSRMATDPNFDIRAEMIRRGIKFVREETRKLLLGQFPLNCFVLSKSLSAEYKNPESIAHRVLADRANERGTDNFQSNDRVAYVHVVTKNPQGRTLLQGDKIETVSCFTENNLKIDYAHYVEKGIAKPISQVFELVLEEMPDYRESKHSSKWRSVEDAEKRKEKRREVVSSILFKQILDPYKSRAAGNRLITDAFTPRV